MHAKAFGPDFVTAYRAGKLCYLSRTSRAGRYFVPFAWTSEPTWLVRVAVAPTQELFCGDYWILFTYLPTQMLPFSYPVTDRYFLLPSVGAVILIAWLLIKAADHLHRWKVAAATTLVTAVSLIWLAKTVAYLSEWQDPRSVWFAATRKSDDVHLYYELG